MSASSMSLSSDSSHLSRVVVVFYDGRSSVNRRQRCGPCHTYCPGLDLHHHLLESCEGRDEKRAGDHAGAELDAFSTRAT